MCFVSQEVFLLAKKTCIIHHIEMLKLDLCRSTRFVSLDTHPANNSLVVTYEILVLIKDPSSGRELCRRSKRDQFQIGISALDSLNEGSAMATMKSGHTLRPIPLNMRHLAETILARCPMLLEANRAETLEDIQLNLLYLFNRKQAQLTNPSRPPSSTAAAASMRLRSGTPSGARFASTHHGSASSGGKKDFSSAQQTRCSSVENPLEIYQYFCEKELKLARRHDYLDYERLDEFVLQLDEHIAEYEDELQVNRLPTSQVEDLEAQLEDLYGDAEERRRSIAIIRRFVRNDDKKLISVSSNRLLVCAILRILRDSEGTSRDRSMGESILYCLIRFTSFEDVFNSMALAETVGAITAVTGISGENESLDLIRVIIDLLDNHVRWLIATCENDLRLLTSNSYYTNSLLVILANLLRLDSSDDRHRMKRMIIHQHGTKLADILSNSLILCAKHLARDIRTSNKSHKRITVTLMEVLSIARQFSVFKDFVNLIRTPTRIQPIVDSLISILNTLQLSRPGSGSSQLQQVLVGDRATLFKIYELEIELISVVNNLIYDTRFRTRFTRNNPLLKCILRSLVVFLASSRKSNTLNPFNGSLALIAPLKCLYELSCSDKIKRELFESRVIMKCLFEYLLSSSNDLAAEIDTYRRDFYDENDEKTMDGSQGTRTISTSELDLNQGDQIVLDTRDASQYIASLWVNLSARPTAPFYQDTEGESSERHHLQDYINIAIENVKSFTSIVVVGGRQKQFRSNLLGPLINLHLMNYVHMKLLRNLTQFLVPTFDFGSAMDKLISVVDSILKHEQLNQLGTFVPLLIECLAILTNFIDKSAQGVQINFEPQFAHTILVSLFDHSRQPLIDGSPPSSDIENDDLLLVAINFLGSLAQRSEICTCIDACQDSLVTTINLILERRTSDIEMLISCLFALGQLMNHAGFLQYLGASFEITTTTNEQHSPRQMPVHQLIEQLSSLVIHPNSFVVKLSDQVLNKLKQFEESQSLADSITCQKRFVSYNSKWLGAIRANREDPSDGELSEAGQEEFMGSSATPGHNGTWNANTSTNNNADNDELELDEYRQLRTINIDDTRTWSRLTSTSSVSRSSSRPVGMRGDRACSLAGENGADDDEGDDDEEDDNNDDDEEDDEDTFSEPDVNVIDSMSMIGHLTNKHNELQG